MESSIQAYVMVSPRIIEEKLTTKFKQTSAFRPRLEQKLNEYCEVHGAEITHIMKNVNVIKQEYGYKVLLKATIKPIKKT